MSESKVQSGCERDCKKVVVSYEECGVGVKKLPKEVRLGEDGTFYSIADVAELTGSPDIFSGEDALAELIVNERVEQGVGDETRYSGSVYFRVLAREVARAELDIKNLGVNGVLATFPEAQRVALKNQAARFMEDAEALVRNSKK